MSTRYEGAGATDVHFTVIPGGEEIGDDEVPEGEIALAINYDEVFYLQGTPSDVNKMLARAESAFLSGTAKAAKMFDMVAIKPPQNTLEANQARVRGDQEPCAVCGRPVRDVYKFQVHLSNNGTVYPTYIDTDVAHKLPEGTMYFYPVGPDCAKKFPAGYVHVATKEEA